MPSATKPTRRIWRLELQMNHQEYSLLRRAAMFAKFKHKFFLDLETGNVVIHVPQIQGEQQRDAEMKLQYMLQDLNITRRGLDFVRKA